MGLIATLLSFVRGSVDDAQVADVAIDPGGGASVTAQHFGPAGDDAQPLPGDFVATIDGTGSGAQTAVAYLDPANAGVAAAGEKRIYSRDADGVPIAVVWLRSDGTIEIGLDPTDAASRASRVLEELQAIKSDLEGFKATFDAHVHVTTATVGSSATVGTLSAPAAPFPAPHTPESVASETVKIEP